MYPNYCVTLWLARADCDGLMHGMHEKTIIPKNCSWNFCHCGKISDRFFKRPRKKYSPVTCIGDEQGSRVLAMSKHCWDGPLPRFAITQNNIIIEGNKRQFM